MKDFEPNESGDGSRDIEQRQQRNSACTSIVFPPIKNPGREQSEKADHWQGQSAAKQEDGRRVVLRTRGIEKEERGQRGKKPEDAA